MLITGRLYGGFVLRLPAFGGGTATTTGSTGGAGLGVGMGDGAVTISTSVRAKMGDWMGCGLGGLCRCLLILGLVGNVGAWAAGRGGALAGR